MGFLNLIATLCLLFGFFFYTFTGFILMIANKGGGVAYISRIYFFVQFSVLLCLLTFL